MPELGPYGSVRGALSNERPYRDSGAPFAYKTTNIGSVGLLPRDRRGECGLVSYDSDFVVIYFDLGNYGPQVGSPRLYVAALHLIPHEPGESFETGGGNNSLCI